MTVDTQKFQELLLADEVASPDRDDGPHKRNRYAECRANLVTHIDAYVEAEIKAHLTIAQARIEELSEMVKRYAVCMNTAGIDALYKRIAELEAAQGEPDMLWQADDNDVFANGPDEFARDYADNCLRLGEEADVRVDCAIRASKRTMRIMVVPKGEDDTEVVWEWVDIAAAPAAAKGTYVPVPGLKLVAFDELNPEGEECRSFVIDDERAKNFHREHFVKNHLEPVFRFVPALAAAPAQGVAKRLRDLAAGKITGEIPAFEYNFAADRIQELENIVEQMKSNLVAVHSERAPTQVTQDNSPQDDTGALINAAEQHAKAYDDDDRVCIKADVMNGFYAGSAWRAANPVPATDQKLEETDCIVDILGRPCLKGSPSCINAEHFQDRPAPATGPKQPESPTTAPAVQERAMDMYRAQRTEADLLPALERLRYFCSLAMKGHDWIDSEQFFDDVAAELAAQAKLAKGSRSELVATIRDRVERLRYIDESSRKLLIEAADFIESAQVARSESMTDFQDLLRQVKERIGVGNSMTIYGIARADTEPPQIEAKENAQSDANTSESAKPPPTE